MFIFLNSHALLIVEKNPKKFKLEDGEITNRKLFIEQTRTDIKVEYLCIIDFKILFYIFNVISSYEIQCMKDKMSISKSGEKDRQSRQVSQ